MWNGGGGESCRANDRTGGSWLRVCFWLQVVWRCSRLGGLWSTGTSASRNHAANEESGANCENVPWQHLVRSFAEAVAGRLMV
ncbi:MAG UNVERIFIED_CONTAM: hypothetical protein LVR18_07150 [Planctomycetaceae bacterium]